MKLTIGTKLIHPEFGEGVIYGMDETKYKIYFKETGEKNLGKSYVDYEIVEEGNQESSSIELEDVIDAVQNVFDQYYEMSEPIELGDKWDGGTMILKPGSDDLKSKEIPIETFFHKIVMMRDRLRVLEQNINSQKKLSDEEKVNLQQYITRIYGSMTSFNVLFRHKNDHFKGESKSS